MLQLNNLQKQWLFDRHYVTAKVLDACVEPGWQDYFINYFNWNIFDEDNDNGWYHLILQAKDGSCYYHADLHLKRDYKVLTAIY